MWLAAAYTAHGKATNSLFTCSCAEALTLADPGKPAVGNTSDWQKTMAILLQWLQRKAAVMLTACGLPVSFAKTSLAYRWLLCSFRYSLTQD